MQRLQIPAVLSLGILIQSLNDLAKSPILYSAEGAVLDPRVCDDNWEETLVSSPFLPLPNPQALQCGQNIAGSGRRVSQ